MNLVDSSGWLAFFADEPGAAAFVAPLRDPERLVVPTVVIYEVFKVILREAGEQAALLAYGAMTKGTVVDLTAQAAVSAAKLGLHHRLPMADSIILSIARVHGCTIWTQDADFDGIPGVRYFPKTA